MIRIDHFRGFEAYWEVPGNAKTAANGRWVQAPGAAFFRALQQRLRRSAADRRGPGRDHAPVEALRDEFGLPGMRILQFGFSTSAEDEKHLPHRFVPHCVVYTGTHDNDTSRGWLTSKHVQTTQSAGEIQAERAYALRYLGTTGEEFHWDMIRLAFGSVADIAIIPMQDILGLDSSARMNMPGKAEGNWGWRFRADQLTAKIKDHLAELTAVYSRWNGTIPARLDPHHVPTAAGESKTSDESKQEARRWRPDSNHERPEEKPPPGRPAHRRARSPERRGQSKQAGLEQENGTSLDRTLDIGEKMMVLGGDLVVHDLDHVADRDDADQLTPR